MSFSMLFCVVFAMGAVFFDCKWEKVPNLWIIAGLQISMAVSIKPPTFVIFVNDKELMHFSYTRYLENKIREAFGFRGTSLKFIIRERNGEK